jgi:hypothetical protein
VREVSIEIVLDGVSDYIDDVGLVFFRKLRGRETIEISERISECG